MHPLSPWVHSSLRHLTRNCHARFLVERPRLREVQLAILRRLLAQSAETTWGRQHGVSPAWSYQHFAQKIQPSGWQDWQDWVERERRGETGSLAPDVERFQPTSGSTFRRKWIPYTKSFLGEIDQATAAWMHDLYLSYPGVSQGRHYWSLSWLPSELRQQMSNDDLAYFPWLKRLFLERIMAAPHHVQLAATSDEAKRLTLRHLVRCEDLSLLFVWSPTFLWGLCEELWLERDAYAEELDGARAGNMRAARDMREMVAQLWPKLSLISCWDTADAAPWAKRVQALFPGIPLQGKGLFATEGVVTIPVQGESHLAYQSHFYEFERPDGEIVPAWELVAGERVSVLLTTGSGIMRLRTED